MSGPIIPVWFAFLILIGFGIPIAASFNVETSLPPTKMKSLEEQRLEAERVRRKK